MIIIGTDHSGIELKNEIIKYLSRKDYQIFDVNETLSGQDKIDYPDIAYEISKKVLDSKENIGIAICGTGIGISISCNKIKGIRAALCTDDYMARMAKEHNNANVICFGARLKSSQKIENIKKMLQMFLTSNFEGERHSLRIDKICKIEEKEGNRI